MSIRKTCTPKKPTVRPWAEILASLKDQLPPKRVPAASGGAPHRAPRPWAEIRSGIECQTSLSLLSKPMPSFFMGAGLLSRCKYFLWRGKHLATFYSCMCKDGPRTYQNWIRYASNLISNEEYDLGADGYTVMYYMLIEPFALLDLTEPDNPVPKPQPVNTSGKALGRSEKNAV